MVNAALLVERDLKLVLENAWACRVGMAVSLCRVVAVAALPCRVEDANVQHALVTQCRPKNVKLNHVKVTFFTGTPFFHIRTQAINKNKCVKFILSMQFKKSLNKSYAYLHISTPFSAL